MAHSPMNVTQLAAADTTRAARVLSEVRSARLSGQPAPVSPRRVIEQSWERMLRSGVDPDHDFRADLLSREEVQRRRETSVLRHVLPVLREGLLGFADVAHHIMVVADEEGRVLWREGSAPVLRKADGLGFELGADWREDVVGTNGLGTPAVVRRPVQVFASEHFVRSQAGWTCAGAPLTDPRDGRLLGVVDVSGPLETMHPATLAWVDSVAKLAEARLRERHQESLERLRAVAAPVLARLDGRALVVDRDGWTAAVSGTPYTRRVALPKSLSPGPRWVPALGLCSVEPLAGGWLLRAAADEPVPRGATRIVLDLRQARRWTVAVSGGAGSWTRELSPRHAELLYLLAVHRTGRSASDLAGDVFGDPARTVTVRAEMSRVRRYLGAFLEHRPYRFAEDAEVEVVLPDDPNDLLPHSTAPAVGRLRSSAPAP
ncbi:Acetoin dehydrogenase operon transcriptional activator AcoR [Streptomyces chartreusis NRRL 3882]|uniref:Acetoin dehydrogenase operon transcriptional activator AcoR n=2 Tax=Streptomyces chartreusis TaxID=1969 RepID=A0A2N9B4J7_STRCX|nr:GAF domain-containing protein [Streptomyces chartreusis]SOR78261.1 Acetoin dehydrogenase operon transcriptional activator AcoR [Streptomyces chartreusis NRRL 3882]